MNEEQREAVYNVNGPLLILAGAGSGKTTVLVNRIAYIIKYGNSYLNDNMTDINESELEVLKGMLEAVRECGDDSIIDGVLENFIENPCPAYRILSITFTNKAANEMKSRFEKILDEKASDLWSGTFHSVCMRILRVHIEKLGYAAGFSIYDMDDVRKQILDVMKELNIDDKVLPVKSVINTISRFKEKLLYPDDISNPKSDIRLEEIMRIYKLYQKKMEHSNALDFDDIISLTVKLLRDFDDIKEYYANKFEYILIDEYQDTNYSQYMLVSLLASKYGNIMVVGDDDQSIYKFRGATIENIINFNKQFENAKVIKLEQNYRSTQTILNAANHVISNNSERMGKDLWTNKGEGVKIALKENNNQNDEAQYIISEIKKLTEQGYNHRDIAILYRINAQGGSLEAAFVKNNMPFRTLGIIRFYDRKEIKDILAYLYVISNPNDMVRLKRIINEPKRGIGDTTMRLIEEISFSENISFFDVVANADKYAELTRSNRRLKEFSQMINEFREYAGNIPLPALMEKVFDESGYRSMLEKDEGEEDHDRLNNVKELISSAITHAEQNADATLETYLEEISLISDIDGYDASSDSVVLMTMHSAKGLEFPVVILPGFEDDIFPSKMSHSSGEQIEEERRLAYVAITRAKEMLYLTYTRERLLYGKTMPCRLSRFASEIPDEYLEKTVITGKQKTFTQAFSNIKKQERKIPENGEFASDYKTATHDNADNKELLYFNNGDQVKHPNYGNGFIISMRDFNGDILYDVAFENVGTKRILGKSAKLSVIR